MVARARVPAETELVSKRRRWRERGGRRGREGSVDATKEAGCTFESPARGVSAAGTVGAPEPMATAALVLVELGLLLVTSSRYKGCDEGPVRRARAPASGASKTTLSLATAAAERWSVLFKELERLGVC